MALGTDGSGTVTGLILTGVMWWVILTAYALARAYDRGRAAADREHQECHEAHDRFAALVVMGAIEQQREQADIDAWEEEI